MFHAVVSGSFLLSLLHRPSNWIPNDMDIYVPRRRGRAFVRQLSAALGIDRPTVCEEDGYSLMHMTMVRKVWMVRGNSRTFQVIEAEDGAADGPVPAFHSTLLMNLLGHDHISVAYPKLTMEGRGVLRPDCPLTPAKQAAIVKYMERGYDLRYPVQGPLRPSGMSKPDFQRRQRAPPEQRDDTTCGRSYTCPKEMRGFYDSVSLLIPLGGNKVTQPNWTVEWDLGGFGCGEGCIPYGDGELHTRFRDRQYPRTLEFFPVVL